MFIFLFTARIRYYFHLVLVDVSCYFLRKNVRYYSNPIIHYWFFNFRCNSLVRTDQAFYLEKAVEEGIDGSNFAVDGDNYDEDREVRMMALIQIY